MMLLYRRGVLSGAAALLAAGPAAGRPRPAAASAMVNDARGLRAALRAVRSGDVVELVPGDYDDGRGPLALAADGVVLRAAADTGPGVRKAGAPRPVLRVPLVVGGDAVRLEGLAFADGRQEARRVFGPERLRISGANVVVANGEFFGNRGSAITITGSARNPYIHDCYFHDPVFAGDAASDAVIQVGQSMRDTNTPIRARIEDNRFERCTTSPETISVKSSANMLRRNTLVACRNLTNRHGEDNVYEGNTLERSGWLTVFDRGTRVLDNRATSSSGIRVMAGDIDCDAVMQGGQPQACDTFLEGNSGLLVVGFRFGSDRLPAEDTVVRSHNGRIELRRGTQVRTCLPGGCRGTDAPSVAEG
jgi:Chondroitinase B